MIRRAHGRPIGSVRRFIGPGRGTAGLPSLALLLALAMAFTLLMSPPPARAQTGLERVVGPISAADRLLLPPDPKLWGAYRLADTPDLCRRGPIGCVDRTIAGMYDRFDPLAAQCHHSAVFSLLYLRVTEKYRDVSATPGYFLSPNTVNTEDTDFAKLYTRAFDRWYADRPATDAPIWRLAFAAADAEEVTGSGDALLGMVAHIKRDLPFALWRIALGNHGDHLKINEMLKAVYPSVSKELSERFDPTISPDGGALPTGDAIVDAIATWRDQAWQDAQDLLAAPDQAAFTAVALRIERSAWDYGMTIYRATRYTLDSQRADRETYCKTQLGPS